MYKGKSFTSTPRNCSSKTDTFVKFQGSLRKNIIVINKEPKPIIQSFSQYKSLFCIINLKCNNVYEIERFKFHKCLLPGVPLWIYFPRQTGLSTCKVIPPAPISMKYIKTAGKPCLATALLLQCSTFTLQHCI